MSSHEESGDAGQAELLSIALRSIRKARRLTASEVAAAMGLALRTYERFEAGQDRIDLERVMRFAEATDSDPFAIIASVWLKTPEFAVQTADNKPMVVMMLALRNFHDDIGDDITLIEPRVFWGGFRRLFQDLTEHVRKRDLSAETWLDDQARRMGLDVSFSPRRRRPRDSGK
ncbi:helix-turn-helix domain-containing protein [Phenylobacterium sp.]|uniref:helix-turn-helix domain-containing protein n=1 Tax=Phenylobacterium sp. TaxID=1871053 RepID=UPI002FC5F159